MSTTYSAVAQFAQTWGLLYFVVVFAAVVAYALWPSRKAKYDELSHVPLRED
jgi:cytochrome c oxidase cbb3-type subunit IV